MIERIESGVSPREACPSLGDPSANIILDRQGFLGYVLAPNHRMMTSAPVAATIATIRMMAA
jgi:hypothetical protein